MEAKLKAELRVGTGKSVTRKLRKAGKIPAVLYGPGREPQAITLDLQEVRTMLSKEKSKRIFELHVDSFSEPCEVLIKDMQRDAIRGDILHIDCYETVKGHQISAVVPITLKGKAYGVSEQGGALQFLTRSLRIKCLPKDLPEVVEVNIEKVKLGESLTVGKLDIDPDITVMEEQNRVIVSVISVKARAGEDGSAEDAESEEAAENIA